MTGTGKYLRIALGVVVIAALIIVPMNFNRYGLFILSQWAVMTIAAMGLNLTLGYAGQVSLAQGAFVGIGAYAAAIMTTQGLPLIAALGVAIILCFAIGWILGYPALRVQHHYLAFVTLAFSTLAFLVFRNEDWLTKGIYGISNIPRPNVMGFATNRPLPFYYFCLGSLGIVSLAMWWLIRSPWGRAFVALRENPVRALSLGIDTRRYTLMAFAIGSALGGVAGTLYAPLTQYIDPVPFNLARSVDDGDRRRFGILLRAVPRRDDCGAAAGMAALHARLLPDDLCGRRDAAPDLFADRHSRHPRSLSGRAPHQGGIRTARGRQVPAGDGAMTAVLEVSEIKKSFGGIKAVDDVSFDVQEGEILGLIGPNGCGKSTLFNCILGQLTPTGGEVKVDGKVVTGLRPSELNSLGVSRTFQLLQVFPKLSVRENLILAGQEHQGNMMSRLFGPSDAGLSAAADQMIGFFKLDHLATEAAGGLSYGQQKLLDAAMAFMGGPRLVLLDEPAGGVNLTMLGDLKERLAAINREKRATFVVIEHNMEFVMSLCTRVMVMAEGKLLAMGTPSEVRANPAVIEAYLGH
jgi:ABC-type branched-subunit amino acid transport system ATPase component/ABC-type branched-subunit amino acid transport system permease subunit